ncbi:hypothetical protein RhiirA4_472777 [Rhizophagus irregularis]|uniref:Uncharacterized protein n=1 Tax=Rhizophagus irregularis TaxID=588596 RepID=A0A2I1H5I5_9GLOM|nr:hypothetical protein RhiirA4_472777 [Rhizophagus irregularis]
MDTTIVINKEEVMTWVNDNKKPYMKAFFDPFHDVFDSYLAEVVKCKKIEEYIAVEEKLIGPSTVSKPGKIPIRLNKPETKVPAVYYFISLFLIKWAGVHIQSMIEALLHRERTAAVKYEQIKMQNAEVLENYTVLTKKVGDSDLTNSLMIADLENRIRNLEVDVIAKERIILEKSEANNILWEKIKALEEKEKETTCQNMNIDLDNIGKFEKC